MKESTRSAVAASSIIALGTLIIGAMGFIQLPQYPAAESRTAVAVQRGDTIVPSFSIKTDTVLGLANTYNLRVKGCGASQFIVRLTNKRTAQVIGTMRMDFVACPTPQQADLINAGDTSKTNPACGFSSDPSIHPCLIDSSLSPALKTGSPCAWTIVRDTTIACLSIPKAPPNTVEAPPVKLSDLR